MRTHVRPRAIAGTVLASLIVGLLILKALAPPFPARASTKGRLTFKDFSAVPPYELGFAWASLQKEAKEFLRIELPAKPTCPPQPLWGGVIIKTQDPWVLAGAAGRPSFVGFVNGLGYVIVLDHGNNTYTVYGLLEDALVYNLEYIAKGQVIGLAHAERDSRNYRVYFAVQGKTPHLNQYLKGDSLSWVNR